MALLMMMIRAYQIKSHMFSNIAGISRVYFLTYLMRINMEPPLEPPFSNSKIGFFYVVRKSAGLVA